MVRKPNVMVLANCTHASISRALRNSELFGTVESAELFSMAPEGLAAVSDRLSTFDFILSLEHGDKFGPLATARLRERFKDRLLTLPTPFFSGLMPDMAYIKKGGDLARAAALLGDYHSALILEEARSGLSEAEVVERYDSGEAFERLDIRGVWEDNLSELKKREAENDIILSDFIETRTKSGKIIGDFLSFNHPTEGLINGIAAKFIERVTDAQPKASLLTSAEHNLYRDAYWPVHPVVSQALGLPVSGKQLFKAPDRLGAALMTRSKFAQASYRYFMAGGQVNDFEPMTPAYLSSRIQKGRSLVKAVSGMEKQVILTHFGRSGSTVLAKMLSQNPGIHWLEEFFSLMSIRSRETYNFTLDQMLDMANKAVADIGKRKPGVIVGYEIKLMNFLQNPSCNLIDYLQATRDSARCTHIILRRRNVMRRIFSVYKAMHTKVYHIQAGSSAADDAKKTYQVDFTNLFDPDTGQVAQTLPELIEKALAREEQVMANFRKLGISYLELWYEDDIAEDPHAAYRKVCAYIGAPEAAADVTLAKTGGNLRDEISNYDQVVKALNGTAYEWMLN